MISSCFGRKKREEDHEALLPRYQDDTVLQREMHQKMHSYQMLRALSSGFMPSNEQVIVNLRTLLASDILNPEDPDISDSGRQLVRNLKQWLHQFIDLLLHKNSRDQIQDFLWFLSKANVSVDTKHMARRQPQSKIKSDVIATYESLQTVGGLLLTNSDFRLFLGDLNTIGRQVFADAAFSLSNTAEQAGKTVEPFGEESKALSGPGQDQAPPPTDQDLAKELGDVSTVVGEGLAQTGADVVASAKENLSGQQKETILNRLKQAVTKLRKRPDYSESVSTIGFLLRRYLTAYARNAEDVVDAAQEDIHTNDELDRAAHNFWALLTSFGSTEEWETLEKMLKKVTSHSEKDPEFETLMSDVGTSVQKMLQDPSFFDSADKEIEDLRVRSQKVGTESSLRQDIDDLLVQARRTFHSVLQDEDVSKLLATSWKLASILSPVGVATNTELLDDSLHIFVPLIIQAIQYLPIPRLEVSTPEVDLLLENLIIEPGRTVNNSSFLPYKLRIETYNDLEIRKARFRTTSSVSTLVSIKIDGLSFRADEMGFWLRAHSGLLRLADEGIASFELDERGIDVHIDVEVGKERLENILSLKDVRVHIHHLNYSLRKSKLSFFAWILKPLIRPLLRKTMEKQLATALGDLLHAANRELLYARERLRATRIADPQDMATFVRAIMARLTPAEDPDLFTAVGVKPTGAAFRGVYAPGSLVKLWEEEGRQARERVEDYAADGWRNDIFDVNVA